jgi:excisionase family DNA binding protein
LTLTVDRAASFLGVTRQWVLKLVKDGRLSAWKERRGEFDSRKRWIVTAQSVDDYDRVRAVHKERLKAWRRSWAIGQIAGRQRRAQDRRARERIEAGNRAL